MKKKELSDYMSKLGKKGGKNRAMKLSKKRRIEIARMGGLSRRKKNKIELSTVSLTAKTR